jgi:ABC-2 type transport system ATP-binding protein
MKNIISVKELRKEFRSRGNKHIVKGLFDPQWQYKAAVDGISFSVKPGEAVAFLGPNGAGKTTTTKMLTGLVCPSAGEVSVLGYYPFDRKAQFLRSIGLVMGNKAGLNWDLTARQSFELLQRIYEIPMPVFRQRVEELTEMLRVGHVLDTQVRRLSLGERMKLELIGAILHDPEVLFLDEPTIGLDIASKKSVREFLQQLHARGKTLLLTSHDMDDIAEVCDRVVVINHGQIMFDGTMKAMNRQYAQMRYIRLEFAKAAPTMTEAAQYGDVISLDDEGLVLAVHKDNAMQAAGDAAKKFPLQDVTIEHVPLEVIIGDLYNRETKA